MLALDMSTAMERAQTMLRWHKAKGGRWCPSLALREDPETGLSPFSTSVIAPDEILVSCPFDIAVTPKLAKSALTSLIGIADDKLVDWSPRMTISGYIGLHWVYNDRTETDSAGWPKQLQHWDYIASLPSSPELSTPMFFTESEIRLLEGTNLHGAIQDRKSEWQAEAETVRRVLKEEGLTWERYLTAATYLSSRAFPSKLLSLPDQGEGRVDPNKEEIRGIKTETEEESHPVLLPALDLFNHSRGQPITWLSSPLTTISSTSETETSTSKATFIPSISLVSAQSHSANTQIYNNYGPKPNEELLLSYGFVVPSNPDDVVILRLPASQLREKGLEEGKRWLMKRDGEVERGLLDVMRILLGGGSEKEEVDEVDEDEDEHLMHEKEQKDLEMELDVLGALGGMLEDKLGKLQSGEEVEVESVRDSIRKMCEIYRRGQIEILETGMDKLAERIERLEGLMDQGMGGCPCCN